MRIETLEYLIETVKYRSLTAAADNLFISQQGLSKALDGLEKELGVTLFAHSGRRMTLTNDGAVVLDYAERIVEQKQRLRAELLKRHQNHQEFGGLVVLGMPFITTVIFTLLEEDLKRYGLNVFPAEEVTKTDLESVLSSPLGNTILFVGLNSEDIQRLQTHDRNVFLPLFRSGILAAGSRKLISPTKRSITARELAQLPLAYYNEPVLNGIITRFLSKETRTLPTLLHSSDKERLVSFVTSGAAVSFSDEFSVTMEKGARKSGFVYCKLKPQPYVCIGAFIDANCTPDSPQRTFFQMLRNMLDDIAPRFMTRNALDAPHAE